MNWHPQIIPECYADTLLIEMLGFKQPNHQPGIGSVINAFSKKDLRNRLAIGIIDRDKVQPKSLDHYEIIGEDSGIQIRKKPQTRHWVLVISPAFEDWIYTNANAVGVDPANFGFNTRAIFRSTTKRTDVGKNQQVKQLINTLKQKEAPGLAKLQSLISDLLDKGEI